MRAACYLESMTVGKVMKRRGAAFGFYGRARGWRAIHAIRLGHFRLAS